MRGGVGVLQCRTRFATRPGTRSVFSVLGDGTHCPENETDGREADRPPPNPPDRTTNLNSSDNAIGDPRERAAQSAGIAPNRCTGNRMAESVHGIAPIGSSAFTIEKRNGVRPPWSFGMCPAPFKSPPDARATRRRKQEVNDDHADRQR